MIISQVNTEKDLKERLPQKAHLLISLRIIYIISEKVYNNSGKSLAPEI